MTKVDVELDRKRKAAAVLLLMNLREQDDQLLHAQYLLLQVTYFQMKISAEYMLIDGDVKLNEKHALPLRLRGAKRDKSDTNKLID